MLGNKKNQLIITTEEFYYNDIFLSNCIYQASSYLTVRNGTGIYDEHDEYADEGVYNARDQNYILHFSGDEEDIKSFIDNSSDVSFDENHNSIFIRKNFLCHDTVRMV